jgi:hypothetical protein
MDTNTARESERKAKGNISMEREGQVRERQKFPRGNADCLLKVCSVALLHRAVRVAFGGPMVAEPARQDGFPTRREPTRCEVPEELSRRRRVESS